MVGAGEPEDFPAFHAGLAGEDVLDGVVEDVAEGEFARDVGRGHDDGVGLFGGVGVGAVDAAVLPLGVEAVFDLLGLVGGGEFHGGLRD